MDQDDRRFTVDSPQASPREAKVLLKHYLRMAIAYWEVLDEEFKAGILFDDLPSNEIGACKCFVEKLEELYGRTDF
jgi:hypothetical protein